MIREIIKTALLLAGIGLLAGCLHKPQVMDGPGMMYDFASYELEGDWTEICSDTPGTLSFTHDELTYAHEGSSTVSAFQYELDHSTDSGTISFSNSGFPLAELLFRRQVYEYQPVRLLFETDGNTVKHIFIRNADMHYLPEGYIPSPFETEEAAPADPEALDEVFLNDILYGTWVRFGSPYWEDPAPVQITFDENGSVWLLEDDSERQIPYRLLPGSGNAARNLSIDSWSSDEMYPSYSEMRYQEKIISGNTVRMLFGIVPVDGGEDPYEIGNIFVREEDLHLIPSDYRPDLSSDNAPEPVIVRKAYFTENLMDAKEWIGMTMEETGIPADCFDNLNARLDGYLLKESAFGFAVFTDACDRIYIYCESMDLETCGKEMEKMYGEAETYDLPYMGGVGVTEGLIFRKDGYRYDLHQGSEQNHITIEITKTED